jgi:hypothetical protein
VPANGESPQAKDIASVAAARRGGGAATPYALYYELGPHAAGGDGRAADDNEWMYQLEAQTGAPLLGNASRQQQQQTQETQSARDVLSSTARAVAAHLGIALGVAAGAAKAAPQLPQRATAMDEPGSTINEGDVNPQHAHISTPMARVPGDLLNPLREIVATIHGAEAPSHRGCGSPKAAAGPPPEAAACAFFLRSAERLSS